jgi:hypothetical protein
LRADPVEQGKLIVLEGTDDALLGDLAASLCRWLREQGSAVEETREPTNGPAGAQVLLARQGRLHFDPVSMALLCLADRLDHLQRADGMLSWLDEGRCVVCVHYALHTYARLWEQVDWAWQCRIAASCRAPDLTLFVDPAPIPEDPLRTTYLQVIERVQAEGQAIVVIDGGVGAAAAFEACRQHVADLLRCQALRGKSRAVPGTWERAT